VPGWHEATVDLQRDGTLRMAGIILEQHPDRARLFMQWRGMDWPVLVDSMDLLGVHVVPITLLIDEHGVVREIAPPRADARETVAAFLAEEYPAPDEAPAAPAVADLELLERAARSGSVEGLRALARGLVLWGADARLDDAIAAFERALELEPGNGPTEFELGVAFRRRYDSGRGSASDFGHAVEHWSRSLEIDPNHYIRRRRLQQFGPRLDKPYPFYDWVAQARAEITQRGETPVTLPVEPRGAELTEPAREFTAAAAGAEPDPDGRITRDDGRFIGVDTVLVPPTVRPGETTRLHLEFRPNTSRKAHWNNEAEGLVVWVAPPDGWQVDRRKVALRNPPQEVSLEPRTVEIELRSPPDSGEDHLVVYALYYVCEDVGGACLYRRRDLSIALPVADR
jgi:hypothetical protein